MTITERYRPSQSHIWTKCHFSKRVELELGLHKFNNRSAATDRGVAIHKGFEEVLKGNAEWRSTDSSIQKGVEESLELYYTQVLPFHDKSKLKLEATYDFVLKSRGTFKSAYDMAIGGTADVSFIPSKDHGDFAVYDLKTGRVPVSPYRNPQLMLYAVGLANKYEVSHNPSVTLGIIQLVNKTVATYTISGEELFSWVGEVIDQIHMDATLLNEGKQITEKPGAHCRYCSVKEVCPSLRKNLKIIGDLINAI